MNRLRTWLLYSGPMDWRWIVVDELKHKYRWLLRALARPLNKKLSAW